ncbi:MAG: hypothetical protein JRN10_02025 [Nitrososphaerota archaeon]|jgi:hypothetical protein|nr:hypothetical protein [Nitrososphaerota archaeon]MDG6926867.1 hypothetical protein [Nitrososphaerota archaeon]MDG6930015.1 hypothetical protein [Nitrososphaerota archaeon]MDG6931966.1 hypothetical protein [Nitrososphaerota archaeon]MDG6943831.1 hypothetical protein [Nitrososphaerota archaeon]
MLLDNMGQKYDIHDYDKTLRIAYGRLERAKLLNENRKVIADYAKVLESMGLNKGRVAKLVYICVDFGERISRPFNELTKQDIQDLMVWLNGSDYSAVTKSDMKKAFKRFYKWVKTGSLERDIPSPCGFLYPQSIMKERKLSCLCGWL